MKPMTKAIIFTMLFIVSINVYCYSGDGLKKIKDAVITGELNFSKEEILKGRGLCERLVAQEPNNEIYNYYLAYFDYRLTLFGMVNKDKNFANKYADDGLTHLKKMKESSPILSEAKVVMAGIYMMKIALDYAKGAELSSKVFALLDQANKIDPENPRAFLIRGQMLIHTPEMVGGSLKGGIEQLKKAISIFESNNKKNEIEWGYLESFSSLGEAYAKAGEITKAKETYNRALKINPEYGYVKYVLLPQLENKDVNTKTSINDNAKVGKLIVKFSGFENTKGKLLVALVNSEETFLSDDVFRKAKKELENISTEVVFENLPYGTYAISSYHDENNNNKLDTGAFGIPSEAYGFSNNARGTFGPPDFSDAKFEINKPETTIEIVVE